MNDTEFRKRGFLPVACIMHADKDRGAVGRVIVKKKRKGMGPAYFVAALFLIRGKLAYGDAVEITREQAAESQKVAFRLTAGSRKHKFTVPGVNRQGI